MKKVYLIFLFVAIFCAGNSYGQQAKDGTIMGKLTDSTNAEVVDFATVAVFKMGSETMVKGTSSSDGGTFKLFNLPFGIYSVRISFVGYDKKVFDHVDINPAHPVANLGPIRLKQTGNALGEVTITDKKPTVEFGADQITYNVSESLQSTGAVATDILKNVPMVSVDIDGNVTIPGKRNTRVFMDGKPSDYMTSNITDLLNVLPSDAIEKIEVMTNPPVKYSADGEGIINIVLKKGFKVGINGTLSFTGGSLGNYNGNAYASYRTKKLSLNSSYGMGEGQNLGDSYSLRKNTFADTSFYRNNYSGRDGSNFGHNFRAGANWDIDSTQNIRFSTNLNLNKSTALSFTDYHFLDEYEYERALNKQNNSNYSNSNNFVFSTDYTLKIGKSGEQITAYGVYSTNGSASGRALTREYLDGTGVPVVGKVPVQQMYDTDASNHGFEFKVDYDKPLKPRNSLNFGIDANMRTNNNNQVVQNYDAKTLAFLLNPGLTNRFIFDANIYSAYASMSIATLNKWSFRFGGRGEVTDMSFNLSSLADKYILKPYFNFFPNLSASKNFKDKYSVGISYSGKIARPREFSLNPQIETSDSTNISFGNPELLPSFTHSVDLNFAVYHRDWAIYPRLGYSSTNHIIERVTTVTPNGVSTSTFKNLSSSQFYTFNLYGNYRFSKKLNFNGGGTIGKVIYQSSTINTASRNGLSVNAKAGLQLELPKRLAFEGNLDFYSNTSAQGRNSGSVSTNFALRKVFMKNKLRFRLMAVNPFSQSNTHIYTEGLNFNRENYNSVHTRNFSASISYNFTKVGKNQLGKQKRDG